MRRDVREKLIEVARKGETITYGDLMKSFGISRRHIGAVVGEISGHEYSEGRPLISAIVVRSNSSTSTCPKGVPGGGFFGLSGVPGRLKRPEDAYGDSRLTGSEQQFVREQQEEVWKYWKTHNDKENL